MDETTTIELTLALTFMGKVDNIDAVMLAVRDALLRQIFEVGVVGSSDDAATIAFTVIYGDEQLTWEL